MNPQNNPHLISQTDFLEIRAALNETGVLRAPVITGSMTPLIPVGAIIEIVPLTDPPKVFDILVFWQEDRLICHYLRQLSYLPGPDGQDRFVTRGLNSQGDDFPVSPDRILGTVQNFELSGYMKAREIFKAFIRRK